MKKTMFFLAVALCGTMAFAQDKPAAKPAPSNTATVATGDPVIISAGDITIKQSEFEGALKTLPAEYQQYATGPGKRQFGEDYLRVYVRQLRQKLEPDPAQPRYILTEPGVGYRLRLEDEG